MHHMGGHSPIFYVTLIFFMLFFCVPLRTVRDYGFCLVAVT